MTSQPNARTVGPLVVHDYDTPRCEVCGHSTEPLHVLDEDEDTSVALTNAGYCLSCGTLIVSGDGPVEFTLVRS